MSMFGRRFGTLTVIAGAPLNTAGRTQFVCRCDCGTDHIIGQYLLLRGQQGECKHTGFTTRDAIRRLAYGRSKWSSNKGPSHA